MFGCIIAGSLCSIVSVLFCVAASCITVADCQLSKLTNNYHHYYFIIIIIYFIIFFNYYYIALLPMNYYMHTNGPHQIS